MCFVFIRTCIFNQHLNFTQFPTSKRTCELIGIHPYRAAYITKTNISTSLHSLIWCEISALTQTHKHNEKNRTPDIIVQIELTSSRATTNKIIIIAGVVVIYAPIWTIRRRNSSCVSKGSRWTKKDHQHLVVATRARSSIRISCPFFGRSSLECD